jgi:peroxiredoxin
MGNDRRVFVPVVAGIVLTALCVWRIAANKPQDYADQVAAAIVPRPAPSFEALDSENHLVRLGSFLGRHKIVVVFFDGEAGADKDAGLLRVRERFAELNSAGVKVIAISSAIPQQNRAAMADDRAGPFPFPLISDFDPLAAEGALKIHRQWGRLDARTGKPRSGIFVVDRKGQVLCDVNGPKPFESADDAVASALK